jgi:hypothetical protein
VVAAAKGARDELMAINDALSRLATPHLRDPLVFEHDELQIRIGSYASRALDYLKQIEPLNLALAPVVAAVFSTDERDVLVLRYWAIPGEQRLAFDPAHKPGEPARRRFRDELLRLADAGWMHAWATRGTLYWRVGSKTETMVLDEWSVLQPIEDIDDKDEVLAKIARIA